MSTITTASRRATVLRAVTRAIRTALTTAAASTLVASPAAHACSTCGCTLNSDWATQGFTGTAGWTVDLREDFFVQNDLRTGTGHFDRGSVPLPTDQELQVKTVNRNTTLSVDRGFDADWGVNVQLPYISRHHTTIAEGDTEDSSSDSSGIGDLRVIGRYQGFAADKDWGLQLGLKLPTGRTDVAFRTGPQTGEALDRGLQPGTGSTDLLVGAFRFGSLGVGIDYFTQALLQVPLAHKEAFRPGLAVNATAGLRWVNASPIAPQLQVNLRSERRETGDEADTPNSGATLVYLSPGATASLADHWKAYVFLQVPVHQRVNGLQLEPRTSLSVGLRYAY